MPTAKVGTTENETIRRAMGRVEYPFGTATEHRHPNKRMRYVALFTAMDS